jgi:lysozyme family protein
MDFNSAVKHILRHEGGYVNNPDDPGGETKFGISKRSYPNLDIKNLTEEHAAAIYKVDYWDRVYAEKLPNEFRLPMFDMAVNQGVATAINTLQRAAGVKVDGIMGSKTIGAVWANEVEIWIKLMALRAGRYADNARYPIFGKGWMQRLMDVAYSALRRK